MVGQGDRKRGGGGVGLGVEGEGWVAVGKAGEKERENRKWEREGGQRGKEHMNCTKCKTKGIQMKKGGGGDENIFLG